MNPLYQNSNSIIHRVLHFFTHFRNVKHEYIYTLNYNHQLRLEGKFAIVTGATGAIGFATCLRLSSEGAIVGVCGRNKEKIDDTIKKIVSINSDAQLIPLLLDVTNENQIIETLRHFADLNNGEIDILVNNAGGGERNRKAELWNLNTEIVNEVINTNLRGSMLCAKHALQYMIPFKSGKIVNLSSVMGMNGKETMTSYSASKAGIIGFTKALALECGKYGICVNCISPGMVLQTQLDRLGGERQTETNCLGRHGFTDEVASLIAFLVSEEANYITGTNIPIDGGRSIGLK